MSDLSNLPAQLLPADPVPEPLQGGRAAAGGHRNTALQWPAPEQDDSAQRLQQALWTDAAPGAAACEIEGLNGHAMVGHIVDFDAERGVLQLRLAAARSPIALRFEHFRRLTLTQPISLLPGPADAAPADLLLQRPPVPFRIAFKDQRCWEGLTHGHRHPRPRDRVAARPTQPRSLSGPPGRHSVRRP